MSYTIKSSNQHHQNHPKAHQQPQNNQAGYNNNKSKKKSARPKKSLTKTDALKSLANNKDLEKEDHLSSYPSTSKVLENYKNGSPVTKTTAQTKVKSGSWKRSEKSLNQCNDILTANKRTKTLRKRSPTWLQFQSSKVKLQDLNTSAIASEKSSNCRPGALYSDVLFGHGGSNLVKLKNYSPCRTNCTTAQKKLTKAIQKFTAKEHETSHEDEFKNKRLQFPTLENITNNKISSPTFTNSTVESETIKATVSLETLCNGESSLTTDTTCTTSTPPSSPTKYHQDTIENESDFVLLSEINNGASTSDNNAILYGHYLEQHCLHLANGKTEAAAVTASTNEDKRFLVSSICDTPKWNFMEFDSSSDAFPKFFGQFNDENYLRAEKIAWLGLKLALGNKPFPNKYKFQ